MQVDPINPKLKPPGTKHLELKCDALLSTSAFKFKLCRYKVAAAGAEVCASDWVRLVAERRLPEEDLLKYCFSAAFMVAVLHDSMAGAYTRPLFGST